jgi:mannose-6-phosphate isomerase-like protein (cupin superfamily)
LKKHGGSSYVPAGEKRQALHGYSIDLFTNDAFCTRFDVIHSKNNTGLGVNPVGDKTFLVVKGTVYVAVDLNGVKEIVKIPAGNCFHAPRGTIYSIGTSGTDGAELHVVETLDYAKTWEQLEAPTVGETVDFSAIQLPNQVVQRGPDPRTVAQASEMAIQADIRRRAPLKKSGTSAPSNANSTNVIGASPRPGGYSRDE